ncbi:MAG: hypothetical protein QF832_03675, partial [SAR324 cluster bacterium]|nr:hypothetical protein [SAR324 cluster bacterium]
NRQVRYYDAQKFVLKFNQPVRFENWESGYGWDDCGKFDIDFKRDGDQECYEYYSIQPSPDNTSLTQPYYTDQYLFNIGANLSSYYNYTITVDNVTNSSGTTISEPYQTRFRTRN